MEFIQRKVYFQLKEHLDKPEISLVLGPRQSGKTTIMKKLQWELEKKGRSCVFLNLDVVEDRSFFDSQHALIDLIKGRTGKKGVFVFIDEISRLKNAGLFLKGLYDLKTGYKFIVSGSGALELRADVLEPLTGRKKIFYCLPLSFSEFAAYKFDISSNNFEQLTSDLDKKLTVHFRKRQRLIGEYFSFGGYPRVVLAETEKEKREVLREIYSSYLEKDIGFLLGVEKEEAFVNLVRILASQVGNLVNRAELSVTLGLNERTIKKYLYFLEKTFVISMVKPFFRNARKELTKLPKVYFLDLGFLWLARGILPTANQTMNGGVFENAGFLRLREFDFLKQIRFWRTKSGAEVDFVVFSEKTGNPVPVEIKLMAKKGRGRGMMSFIKKYQPEKSFIYFLRGKDRKEKDGFNVEKGEVCLLPYHFLPVIE